MFHLDPQTAECDPKTGLPWQRLLDTETSARYLTVVHGIPVQKKTLENRRARGDGPKWRYFGQKPLCERTELDRFATEDALRNESPLTRRARVRLERPRSVGRLQESETKIIHT
jgi:hypothetical protein